MGREIDSIPFYNKDKQLIASYNVYMKMLYWGKLVTDEDREVVYKTLEKKKYKGYSEMESNKSTKAKQGTTVNNSIDIEEVVDVPKKRKRRTKAEMEKAKAEGDKK